MKPSITTLLRLGLTLLAGVGALAYMAPSRTYYWSEPLVTSANVALGAVVRTLQFSGASPEHESLVTKLTTGQLAPWESTADITPRAIALGQTTFIVATPWLARGRPERASECFYVFAYRDTPGFWELTPSRLVDGTQLIPLAAPSTFLRFDFPSWGFPMGEIRPPLSREGRIVPHRHDTTSTITVDLVNTHRCK